MLVYLFTIVLSTAIISGVFYAKSTIVKYSLSTLGILPLCLLAGFRDETVGHDLVHYMTPTYNTLASLTDFKQFVAFYVASEIGYGLEPLWLLFHFVVSRFTDELFWPFFLQQVFVLGIMVDTCYHFRNKLDPTMLYATLVLYFYCFSMSANRQIFAIALVVFSMRYLFALQTKGNILKFIICILIAWGFHNSGLLVLLLLPMFRYAINRNRPLSFNKIFIIVFSGTILYIFFGAIITALVSHGLLVSKFEKYAAMDYNVHKVNLIFWILIVIMMWTKRNKQAVDNVALVFPLFGIFVQLCGTYNDVATRFAMYFDIVSFIAFLMSVHCARNKKILLIFMIMIVTMHIYLAQTTGFAEAIPYTSKILGGHFD